MGAWASSSSSSPPFSSAWIRAPCSSRWAPAPRAWTWPERPGDASLEGVDDEAKEFRSRRPRQHRGRVAEALRGHGAHYVEPRLVLFDGGGAVGVRVRERGHGPFYCPGDSRVFLDFSFFRQLDQELDAPGDFAQAYVIAHEIGHHVQNLLGITDTVDAERGSSERGGIQPALRAPRTPGRLPGRGLGPPCRAGLGHAGGGRRAGGPRRGLRDRRRPPATAVPGLRGPERFTHGSSAQRVRWFRRGSKRATCPRGHLLGAGSLGRAGPPSVVGHDPLPTARRLTRRLPPLKSCSLCSASPPCAPVPIPSN